MGALEGKTAVVTGGTSGIGARTAELFAAEGARVIVAGRRVVEGEAVAAGLGPDALFVRTDVTVESDVEHLVAAAVDRFGGLDILVNNAGDAGPEPGVAETDLAKFYDRMAIHVGGVVAGMKHAARVMLPQGRGSIINVASIGGSLAGWTGLAYASAKAAVIHISRVAAVELGQHGIRVNALSPGPILTGIFGKGGGMDPAQADRTADILEPVFTSRLENWQPIRRAGVPDDIAPAALWLASDASGFVNGHNLVVDGGISAGRPASIIGEDRRAMGRAFAQLR